MLARVNHTDVKGGTWGTQNDLLNTNTDAMDAPSRRMCLSCTQRCLECKNLHHPRALRVGRSLNAGPYSGPMGGCGFLYAKYLSVFWTRCSSATALQLTGLGHDLGHDHCVSRSGQSLCKAFLCSKKGPVPL